MWQTYTPAADVRQFFQRFHNPNTEMGKREFKKNKWKSDVNQDR
jgi:hypothetical protein